jgi:hemerythrin-like domain-containing protein
MRQPARDRPQRIIGVVEVVMAVQIGAKPDSGFDNPIGMLSDCHRRIERFLDVLCQVVRRARGKTLDAGEQAAVESALRYFRESGPRHNLDEEESLFPRLKDHGAAAVLDEMNRLLSDHAAAAPLHAEVDTLYTKWIADGALDDADNARLRAITARLQQLYSDHIRVEEELVFPCAAKLFDRKTVAAMGDEFKARRH